MQKDPQQTFGARIRAARTARGMSLRRLSELTECASGYLSQIERGERPPPSAAVIAKLEVALSLDRGALESAAGWERTPQAVRDAIAALARGGLDAAHGSGELRRLIESFGGRVDEDAEPVRRALPFEVPLINQVAAGYPAGFTDLGFPAKVADEYVRTTDVGDPDAFAARVVGDSMEPVYREGDVVVFSPARDIEDGSDCFARLEPDHESTFKRVYFERGDAGEELIRLQPINNRYAPRTLPREQVAGLYRAVSVTRSV
ncbi:MAG: LexA family transcriptional regulator [Planctomycetota bacterium]